MDIPAILRSAILVILLAALVLAAGWLAGVGKVTAPQMITLTALWIIPGLLAGLKARDAGTLHGLLAGLLGGVFLFLILPVIGGMAATPSLLTAVAADSRPLLLILAGWWGGFGGLVADIRRAIRARRAARRQQRGRD